MHPRRAGRSWLVWLALAAAACDVPPEAPPSSDEVVERKVSALQGIENFSPKPGTYLSLGVNMELGIGDPGYYALASQGLKVQVPGEATARLGAAATETFDLWKRTFLFFPREEGQTACTTASQCIAGRGCDTTKKRCKPETIQQWRDRTGVVVYYNLNELGLGRELGCAQFPEKVGTTTKVGHACFVTNYGTLFQDPETATKDAIYGFAKKNTVCITYRPSQVADAQVQFWVFDGAGRRQTFANLDHMGKRPVPQVCTRCHGGDTGGGLALRSRFLPLNPFTVKWAPELIGSPTLVKGLSFAEQAERVRKINVVATQTPLTQVQRDVVDSLYSGKVTVAGAPVKEPVIGDWGTQGHAQYFQKVVTPFCGTCHFAFDFQRSFWITEWGHFFDSDRRNQMQGMVCSGLMPHAEPTVEKFWGKSIPLPAPFNNMKDWFLKEGGMLPCDVPDNELGCNVDKDTDNPMGTPNHALCGEQHAADGTSSGRMCDGLCSDDCRVNSDCPSSTECLGQRCRDCGKYGQLACTTKTACEPPYVKKGLICELASDPVNKQSLCIEYVKLHDPICRTTWDSKCDNEAYWGKHCGGATTCLGWRKRPTDDFEVLRPGCWELILSP